MTRETREERALRLEQARDQEIERLRDGGSLSPTDEAPTVPQPDDLTLLEGEGWIRVMRMMPDGEYRMIKKLDRKDLKNDIAQIGKIWGGGKYKIERQNKDYHWADPIYVGMDEAEYGPPKGFYSTQAAVRKATAALEQGITSSPLDSPLVGSAMTGMQEGLAKKDEEIRRLNERMLEQQGKSQDRILEMFSKMVEARAPHSDDGVFDKVMAMVDKVMQRYSQQNQPAQAGPSGTDPLIKQLLPSIAEGFKEFLITGRKDSAAPPADSTALERMAMPFVDIIAKVIARGAESSAAGARQQVPPQRNAPSAGQPTLTPPAGSNNAPQGEQPMSRLDQIMQHPMVKMVAPMLLNMAKTGVTPENAAQEIADSVPDKFWPIVVEIVNKDDMVDFLAAFEPTIVAHTTWLAMVAEILKRDFIETAEEEEETEVEPGDGDNHSGAVDEIVVPQAEPVGRPEGT